MAVMETQSTIMRPSFSYSISSPIKKEALSTPAIRMSSSPIASRLQTCEWSVGRMIVGGETNDDVHVLIYGAATTRIRPPLSQYVFLPISQDHLYDALGELRNVVQEAEEGGFDRPSELAIRNAERILRMMYGIRERRYEVYPCTQGAVIVECPHKRGSVMVMCEANGEILSFLNIEGKQFSRRCGYQDEDQIRIGLRSYLQELWGES